MKRRNWRYLAPVDIAAVCTLAPSYLKANTVYGFQTLNNPADPTFNQLLGINNQGTIAGYFGSGAIGHPNQGYTLLPPATYTNGNFPNSVQTQVAGINSNAMPTTVGFWIDAAGKITVSAVRQIAGIFGLWNKVPQPVSPPKSGETLRSRPFPVKNPRRNTSSHALSL